MEVVIGSLVLSRAVLSCLLILVAMTTESVSDTEGRGLEFYKPPSPCLTGPSCRHCVETAAFFSLQVCCYHCRLDNLVITNDVCHCIDTRLPDSSLALGEDGGEGNCSSGQICDNCAVKISTDVAEGPESSPGVTQSCCQDCGLVMPHLHRDGSGCRCTGDAQGHVHQAAPRHDPSLDPTTTQASSNRAGNALSTPWTPWYLAGLVSVVLHSYCHLS